MGGHANENDMVTRFRDKRGHSVERTLNNGAFINQRQLRPI